MSAIPLIQGVRSRHFNESTRFSKSHVLGRAAHEVTPIDPRDVGQPQDSFSGTGAPRHVDAATIAGARAASSASSATPYANSGRFVAGAAATGPHREIEDSFASSARVASQDRLAHLRRAPVARDYDSTAEPRSHLAVLGGSRLPSWVEFDRKVLRFSGYWKEASFQTALGSDNWRVHQIILYYYLEDDTLHVAEPPQGNSGLAQGVLLKRHRIPKDEQGNCFTLNDLWVGAELALYGRRYRLTGADPFTRAFYETNGAPLDIDEEVPLDPFAKKSVAAPARTFHKTANADSIHAEAAMGNPPHRGVEATQKFLRKDGKVLRFYAVHEDSARLYGEKRPYILHFFLADDTVEVLEVHQPNSGLGNFPALLKRSRLPKDHTLIRRDVAHVGGAFVSEEDARLQYLTEIDLRVGGHVNVYGRSLLLVGADEFTKKYYRKTHGMREEDFAPIDTMLDPKGPEEYRVEVPPPTGFGSDEDSLGSFLFLVPKQPKTDQKKLLACDGILLRFSAQLSGAAPVDRDRKFVVTYFLADDTLMCFETFERNAGHIGGKFLDRCRCKNVRRGNEFFQPGDLYVGGELEVNKFVFLLLEADEYTRKFMESNPQIWNSANGNLPREDVALAFTGGVKFNSKQHKANPGHNIGGRPF